VYCDTLEKLTEKRPLDSDEFLVSHWYNLEDLKKLSAQGKIVDAKTLYAMSVWENMLLTGANAEE
ncbi:NUDIX hydrolase, partial [Lactobacillus sp. XV13L]|nr:NUDIX hydrolase [Lactobacillus sp. XV13L]